MYSLIAATLLASLAPQAMANLFLTSPVASTSCVGGQQCSGAWNDDGKSPSLAELGVMSVGIYVGSVTSQVLIQDLGSIDVSKTSSVPFVAAPQIGPNGGDYFLRFSSLAFKDPANPQYPAQGFSAKFTLTGMSGQFNATVSSLIAGGTGAAPAPTGSSGPATTTPNTSASSPTTKAPSNTSPTTRTTNTATNTPGAASPRAIIGSGSVYTALVTVVVAALAASLSL